MSSRAAWLAENSSIDKVRDPVSCLKKGERRKKKEHWTYLLVLFEVMLVITVSLLFFSLSLK